MSNIVDLAAYRNQRDAERHPLQTTILCGCGEYMWQSALVHDHKPDHGVLSCIACSATIILDEVK